MDLESELRQAMAEHVTAMSAPETLARDAQRRHHRTVRRRTTLAMTAAGVAVVAVAAIPAYQSFRPETVGVNGPGGRNHAATAPVSSSPSGQRLDGRSAAPAPRPPGPSPSGRKTHGVAGSHAPLEGALKALLDYLPPGIDPQHTCSTDRRGPRETTTCRWTGSAGWIEVRLVRDSGLSGPADLGFASGVVRHVRVHGHAALLAAVPSQVMWIEHGGLGVCVQVSAGLTKHLTTIADGLRVE
jgi:hypothetical protein